MTYILCEPRNTAMMEVQIPLTDISKCKEAYSGGYNVIDDRVLCAGYQEGGKDSCGDDAGGPLMWSKGDQYYLMGIVSYGFISCGELNQPGVYTKVTSFVDWIVEKINNNFNMRKEQCFIFVTLMIGLITTLPCNDSTVPVGKIKLTASNLEFASTKPKDKITIKEKINVTSSKLTAQVTCGKRMAPNFRILGGSESQLGAWPWMVALGYKNSQKKNDSIEWHCGGTLISNKHILTASTCVANTGLNILTVARLGELDLDPMVDDGALPLDVPIKRIINHEGYDSKKIINNLAILVLKNSITFNELIQPICLPTLLDMNNVEKSKNIPFVIGWGSINAVPQKNEKNSTSLMEVQIPISNITECKQIYSNYKSVIDDRVLCAGYPEGGKDSCRGDSGGPLMWSKRNQFYLIGVVSYGFHECGDPGHPGVYTKVTSYMDWILNRINN